MRNFEIKTVQVEQEDMFSESGGSPKRLQRKSRKVTSTRAIFMSYLRIPETTRECIIIPSAPEGGFFMNPKFEENYLQGRITRREFDIIINKFSDILMISYAKKRELETRDIKGFQLYLFFLGFFTLISSFVFIFEGTVKEVLWIEVMGYITILLSLIITALPFIIYIKNKVRVFPSFE